MKKRSGTVIDQKTINGRLKKYYIRFVIIAIMLGAIVFLSMIVYSRETRRIVDFINYVQEFFDMTENIQRKTEALLVFNNNENRQKIQDSIIAAEENLKNLETLQIGGNYRRNIADLRQMLTFYLSAQQKTVCQTIKHEETLKRMKSLYESIVRKKEVLIEEIYSYSNRRRNQINRRIVRLSVFLASTFLFSFLLLGEITKELAGQIVKPVLSLSEQAKMMRTDDMEHFSIETPQNQEIPAEIADLYQTFGHLLKQIGNQMRIKEELKEKELENLRIQNELTSSELKCLQMQMNPHFLFNTLNMIQQTLYLDQTEKTSQLLKETASFLRYSLDYIGKTVSLEQELEGLGSYINLMEERFGERIFFEFVLDERLNSWKVPCLILQPLVENSIIHGINEMLQGAEIIIRTQYDTKHHSCRISIEDNGCGMDEKKLGVLRQSLLNDNDRALDRIGLHNVARRLALFPYGKAWMEIESKEKKGTTVKIILTGQMGAKDDSDFNCR